MNYWLLSYNVQVWVGFREHYSDKIHTMQEARVICDTFVNDLKDCITLTPTEFRYVNGWEPGVVIGFIQYPRFPRSRKAIRRRTIALAEIFLKEFNQYRIVVTTPFRTTMIDGTERN